jgi:hypothetical protein
MAQRGRKSKRHHALVGIQNELLEIQKRIEVLKSEGENVDQITALMTTLGTDLDALIAQGQGALTPANVQTIVDGLSALDAKVKAVIAPATA